MDFFGFNFGLLAKCTIGFPEAFSNINNSCGIPALNMQRGGTGMREERTNQ